MVVTGTGEHQFWRTLLGDAVGLASYSSSQRFKSDSDRRCCQFEKPVSASGLSLQESRVEQEPQMVARGLRRDVRKHGEFARGPRFASEQTPQHGGTRWVCN